MTVVGQIIPAEQEFTVKAVCRMTGLNEHTLRAWERRYSAVTPQRLPNGRRLYTAKDVERLRRMVRLADLGHAIGRIAGLGDVDLARLLARSGELAAPQPPAPPDAATARSRAAAEAAADRVFDVLRVFDLPRVYQEVQSARARFGAQVFMLSFVSPLMEKVGHLCVEGKISVAHEHALTAIVKSHLLDMFFHIIRSRASSSTRHLAVATMEGDLHELGVLGGSVLAADHNLCVHYFGANLPPDALAQAALALRCDAVLLGLSELPPGTLPRTPLRYIEILDQQLPPSCEIWAGNHPLVSSLAGFVPKRPLRLFLTLHDLDAFLNS